MRAVAIACACALAFGAASGALADESLVVLDAAHRAEVAVAAVASGEAPLTTHALGRVLDPQPFVESARARVTARTAAEIAQRELARVEALARSDRNASLRDVEAARLAAARARDDLAAAESRAAGLWGAALLMRADLESLVDALAHGSAALARLDLVAAGAGSPPPKRARVRVEWEAEQREVRILGPAPNADPAFQSPALLVRIDPPVLPIGVACEARVELAAVARGVWLPQGAVLWDRGESAVFVARGDDAFERRAVRLLPSARVGFALAEGVAAGDRVVVSGAQQLLSVQRVGAGPAD